MYKQLSDDERDLIAIWKSGGISNKEVAKRLGRNVSTIGRELERNMSENGYYVAISAKAKVEKRKVSARKRHPLKSPEIFVTVIEKLRLGWSPEVISGRCQVPNYLDSMSILSVCNFCLN